jgi:hypothetical protein
LKADVFAKSAPLYGLPLFGVDFGYTNLVGPKPKRPFMGGGVPHLLEVAAARRFRLQATGFVMVY